VNRDWRFTPPQQSLWQKRAIPFNKKPQGEKMNSAFEKMIGQNVMIRTVTMIYTGVLKEVFAQELILTSCHWIAETDRWNKFISETSTREHESYGDREVIVGRGSVIDACIINDLPRGNK